MDSSLTSDLLRFVGGLALFIFAIKYTTASLRAAAGRTMRDWLSRATRGRPSSLGLGTALGILLHSGPTVVLLLGFLHAGLLSLGQAVPAIVGANLGTSLSMQVITFKLGAFFFVPIVMGVVLMVAMPRRPYEQAGGALIGFGMLFLGLDLISHAVAPHRDLLAPWLTAPQASGLGGQLIALALATAATVAMQSSGATIGILFALAGTGAFASLEPILPLVLGAHIGTCSTALVASTGMNAEARRGAWAHLLFNVLAAAICLALQKVLLPAVAAAGGDLVRQTANLDTGVMLVGVLVVVSAHGLFVRAVRLTVRSRVPEPPGSFLDETLLEKPEQALYQAIRELQRVARVSWQSFRLNAEIMFKMNRRKLTVVRRNEDAIDEIQRAMKRYLQSMTSRYLSRRQSILLQHLNRCMIDIERIGDHNDNLADLAESRNHTHGAIFPSEAQTALFSLFEAADKVLQVVIQSLDPEQPDFQATARAILQARDAYAERSLNAKSLFSEKIVNHEWPAIVGIFLSDYVAEFDRIVRHSKMIALAESQPYFWIKRRKLDRVAPEMPPPPPPGEEPHDFLDKLQQEGFV